MSMTSEEKLTQHEMAEFLGTTEPALSWAEWVELAKAILAADAELKTENSTFGGFTRRIGK